MFKKGKYAGTLVSLLSHALVRSYRHLNTAKLLVIHKIEKLLPMSPYDAEWCAQLPTKKSSLCALATAEGSGFANIHSRITDRRCTLHFLNTSKQRLAACLDVEHRAASGRIECTHVDCTAVEYMVLENVLKMIAGGFIQQNVLCQQAKSDLGAELLNVVANSYSTLVEA